MTSVTLHPGDNRESLRLLIAEGIRVHSIVTDPPYGLVSVQKRFGKEGSKNAKVEGTDGSFARLSGGFMGKTWDGTGIERDPEFWKLIYDILLPGGYCFAFSGSRTGHWQACAMEMAGFIMHPMHGWCFGSGFPKAHNASKAIDKMLGTTDQREVLDVKYEAKRFAPGATVVREGGYRKRADEDGNEQTFQATNERGGSPEAAQWDGWAYGTQSQKPALEPIYLAQKPFSEKTGAANLLKHGVGAVNIDGCRVPTGADDDIHAKNPHTEGGFGHAGAEVYGKSEGAPSYDPTKGRHPANLILDGSPDVVSMFPTTKSGKPSGIRQAPARFGMQPEHGTPVTGFGDEGSAARFFHQFGPDTDPLFYHPKAGKLDRAGSRHPTVKPIALMQYLIRHITPPGGVVLDPFAGSGTTAEAARREGFDCILMEAEPEYIEFLQTRFGFNQNDFDDLLEDLL